MPLFHGGRRKISIEERGFDYISIKLDVLWEISLWLCLAWAIPRKSSTYVFNLKKLRMELNSESFRYRNLLDKGILKQRAILITLIELFISTTLSKLCHLIYIYYFSRYPMFTYEMLSIKLFYSYWDKQDLIWKSFKLECLWIIKATVTIRS